MRRVLISVLVGAIAATPALAGQRKAHVSEAAARATALAHVKDGAIKATELEHEHGKFIYSFDIAVPGVSGVEEVHVDAITGKFLSREHEGPLKESIEGTAEHAEELLKGKDR
jgi:hypothetical protein